MTDILDTPTTAEPDQLTHLALFKGQAITSLPLDLYIPPDALEVFLETFEGPLDLLLYLIKKQNLDILDISLATITKQYQAYIELMQTMKLELAAEYLLMAALLAEIKSRLLLPRHTDNPEEEDPRAELVRRLKEYEQFKQAAENLDQLPRVGRDIFTVTIPSCDIKPVKRLPPLHLEELLSALQDVLKRSNLRTPHMIQREMLSVRQRMTLILDSLQSNHFLPFTALFTYEEGRLGVVVTFIAILELLKQSAIEIVQEQLYAPIHVRVCTP
jgi:segregation and condensation protein A